MSLFNLTIEFHFLSLLLQLIQIKVRKSKLIMIRNLQSLSFLD